MVMILFLGVICLKVTAVLTDDKYEILPPLYKIQDYLSCMEKNDLYCSTDIKLRNNGSANNTFWKLIQESLIDKYSHDRSVIHRAICVPKTADDLKSIKKSTHIYINEELKDTDLLPYVEDVVCTQKEVQISLYDIIILLSLLMYIFLLIYATKYDWERRTHKCKEENGGNSILISLSIISNWKKLCNVNGNEDFNRLKSIQGIRFYNMLLILALHTKLSYTVIDLSNPEELGKMLLKYPPLEYWYVLDMFLVQTFFLISSWIVTFQVFNVYRKQGEFTLKHVFIFFINRYFRIGVCLAVLALLLRSSWYMYVMGPLTLPTAITSQRACVQNFWKTLLLMNNFMPIKDICLMPSWYLAADFHFYILAIITLYLILKFKLKEWKVICFLLLLSCVIYGVFIYINEMDIVVRINTKFQRRYEFFASRALTISYMTTYSSWTTSLIGIWLGIIYTNNKNRSIVDNRVLSILWLVMSFGLSCATIFISKYEFEGIAAAVLGPLVKPMFSLGIGIGILGMSHNLGGIIKRVCENKYAVIMSNFSFSIYMFHVLVVFSKGNSLYTMMEFSVPKMIKSIFLMDVPASIIVGIICALLFEQPGINLQKMFLPQLSQSTKGICTYNNQDKQLKD